MNRRGLVFFLFLTVGVGVLNYPLSASGLTGKTRVR